MGGVFISGVFEGYFFFITQPLVCYTAPRSKGGFLLGA